MFIADPFKPSIIGSASDTAIRGVAKRDIFQWQAVATLSLRAIFLVQLAVRKICVSLGATFALAVRPLDP
jgi:hypothetical protein